MAIKVLRVRLAGRIMGAMSKALMSEDEKGAYVDHIQIEQAYDCSYLDAALEDGWTVVGQGQMETDEGLFHYFVIQGQDNEDWSNLEDTKEADIAAPTFTDLGRLALLNAARRNGTDDLSAVSSFLGE